MNTILPIGSVVKIKDVENPIMIFGYFQQSSARPNEVVDFVGVPYPGGNVNAALQLGFQMTDITEVLFEGYETEDFLPIQVLLCARKAYHETGEENDKEKEE